ncbi:hypothetical protein ACQ4PT_044583 [Festuca glaucescens]
MGEAGQADQRAPASGAGQQEYESRKDVTVQAVITKMERELEVKLSGKVVGWRLEWLYTHRLTVRSVISSRTDSAKPDP